MLPPLDLDFFQQLSRMPFSSHIQKDAERLLSFTREQFGSEVGLSMEQFLSEVEYTDRFHQEFNVDRGPIVKRYEKALGHFLAVLPEMFKRVCNEPCYYHDLMAGALHTQDCVISFNYDCVMDDALKRNAFKRWDPQKEAYGFTPSDGTDAWRDHSEGRIVKNTIQLLKLHGSMNWNRKADEDIALEPDLQQVENLEGSIIPPTWFKNLGRYPFTNIWKEARKEVRASRILVVIGYSVPETDLFSKSLLKVEAGSKAKREKLDLLVLVNPDRDARHRFVELINGGVEPKTKILEYRNLEELCTLLDNNT